MDTAEKRRSPSIIDGDHENLCCFMRTANAAGSLVICTLQHRTVAEYDVAVTCQWCSING